MRAFWMTVPLLAALAVPANAAPGTHTVPYKEFFDQMARFYEQGHDRLALRLTILPEDDKLPLVQPPSMVATTAEGMVPFAIDAAGAVDLPYRPDWVAANVSVTVNQAPKTYRMKAQIGMKLPDGATQIAYADVKAAFDQFDQVISKEAGVASFLAPSAKTLRLFCGSDCTVTIAGAKGTRVLKADDRGRVNVPNDKALVKEGPTLTASHPITYSVLTTKE